MLRQIWWLGLVGMMGACPNRAIAQVVPDSTLGSENSIVAPVTLEGLTGQAITGGATRGNILFHSFDRFSISTNGLAVFNTEPTIQTVVSRVTGKQISTIDGTLGSLLPINLFLLNPNGIVFNQNASLRIGGSFVASTANSLTFGNGLEFSATNPQAAPLLTVNLTPGLQMGSNPGAITNRAILGVSQGNFLGLIGGDVNLEQGQLYAPGGRIELGGLSSPGTIEIGSSNNAVVLQFPDRVARSDVRLIDGGRADVISGNGGSIKVTGRNVELLGAFSILAAGVGAGLGTTESKAGDIEIDATGLFRINGGVDAQQISAGIVNGQLGTLNGQGGIGSAGDIRIKANTVEILGNSSVGSFTNGRGDSGNVSIDAAEKIVINTELFPERGVLSTVANLGQGNGANINITSPSINLKNTLLTAQTDGEGNAGNIQLTAEQGMTIENSLLSAESSTNANAGNIRLRSSQGVVSLLQSVISSKNTDTGFAGDVRILGQRGIESTGNTIEARSNNQNDVPDFFSVIRFDAPEGSLTLNGSKLSVANLGGGFSGDVVLSARDQISIADQNVDFVNLTNPTLSSRGRGGRIRIGQSGSPDTISPQSIFVGNALLDTSNSDVTALPETLINSGEISLRAIGNVFVDASQITSRSSRQGNAGSISVTSDTGLLGIRNSFISTDSSGTGLAGDITVQGQRGVGILNTFIQASSNSQDSNSDQFSVIKLTAPEGALLLDRAKVSAENLGGGFSGDLFLGARDQIIIFDQDITNENARRTLSSRGREGRIRIGQSSSTDTLFPQSVSIIDAAIDTSNNLPPNESTTPIDPDRTINVGEISIRAIADIAIDGTAIISSTSRRGNAGDVRLQSETGSILLNRGSTVFSTVEPNGVGNAGKLSVTGRNLTLSNASQFQTIVRSSSSLDANSGQGNAGDITLDLKNGDVLITGFATQSLFGEPQLVVSGVYSQVDKKVQGNGGNISINAQSLTIRGSGSIDASTAGTGTAGRIRLNIAKDIIMQGLQLDPTGSIPFLNKEIVNRVLPGATGNGNDIVINVGSLSLKDLSVISTATLGGTTAQPTRAGNISITAKDAIQILDLSNIRSNVDSGGVGLGGDVSLTTSSLTLANGGQVSASVFRPSLGLSAGQGKSGNLQITATDFIDIAGVGSLQAKFLGQSVPDSLKQFEGFSSGLFTSSDRGTTAIDPTATSSQTIRAAGDIQIKTGELRLADRGIIDALTSNAGQGGTIRIDANNVNVTGGGQIVAATRSSGDAGSVILNVPGTVRLSGFDPSYQSRIDARQSLLNQNLSTDLPTDVVNNQFDLESQRSPSGIFSSASQGASGRGGNIVIDTKGLILLNGAQLSTSTNTATGGDIRLNTGVLAAFGNSDITANAGQGIGGRIQITTQGIFGPQFRDRRSPQTSDITATSDLGPEFNGTVEVNVTEVDPSRGLTPLPSGLSDPTNQISQACSPQAQATNSFTNVGRGGIAAMSGERLGDEVSKGQWVTVDASSAQATQVTKSPKPIVEAQTWRRDPNGDILLMAEVSKPPHFPSKNCPP